MKCISKTSERHSKTNNLAAHLLFNEPHSNMYEPKSFHSNKFTETLDSMNAATSESADTFRTRISHSILNIALSKSVPVKSNDSRSDDVDEDLGAHIYDNSQMENMARHYAKNTMSTDNGDDGINLEYAVHDDSEEGDLLSSPLEWKKSTLSNSRVYDHDFNNDIEGDNDDFIVIDNM